MKKLPVGIENFEEIRTEDFYYVDKTGLISNLLNNWSKVNIFTRPRRFGKTLNMSMLKSFFSIGADPSLFSGLNISREKELCDKYMGTFPVIFLTLKGVDGLSFETAYSMLKYLIHSEMARWSFLQDSLNLTEADKAIFKHFLKQEESESELLISLKLLSQLLYKHYNKKVIILIDEYDVPLDKAFNHGYYDKMVALIRGLFGEALKTNNYLQFAVLTGCLRISKESIFTGLNNLRVLSIVDKRFDEQFGFTDSEVRKILEDYNLSSHYSEVKLWYDGYHFGNTDVYCPWDVINYVDSLLSNPNTKPEAYWINTSSNDLVKRFVDKADKTTQSEIEKLINGEQIEKDIRLDLTYNELDNTIDNLWSVLFATGYLTDNGRTDDGKFKLVIPNKEVREVFVLQIQEWFKETFVFKNASLSTFFNDLKDGNDEGVEKYLNFVMNKMISILDTKAKDSQKENFYHGLLLGLLRGNPEWMIMSNVESGDGFADIIIETEEIDDGIVIEVKYSPSFDRLKEDAEKALKQIRDLRYTERLKGDGRENVISYGIAFSKKRCKVRSEKM